jgi:hypothetical protein
MARLYLSLAPEALVASTLEPEEFGKYLALGSTAQTRGHAIFFEVDPDLKCDAFPMHLVAERCVPHADGRAKNSLYLSIYRALEHLPMSAIGDLYLATDDGKVLRIERAPYEVDPGRKLHLYQEFCPVLTTVASRLDAVDFCRFVTSPDQVLRLPKLVFAELILRDLAMDPLGGGTDELPYKNMGHLRGCLARIEGDPEKLNKMVFRKPQKGILFRTIRNGFFVGDAKDLHYYPMPSAEDLQGKHYEWWRSAQVTRFV